MLVKIDLVIGLRMQGIGMFQGTVTGAHRCLCGSAMTWKRYKCRRPTGNLAKPFRRRLYALAQWKNLKDYPA